MDFGERGVLQIIEFYKRNDKSTLVLPPKVGAGLSGVWEAWKNHTDTTAATNSNHQNKNGGNGIGKEYKDLYKPGSGKFYTSI
jgi:hypothetical protein